MKRVSFVGIVIVVLAIFLCFGYSFYQISQLQSQVTDLQQAHNQGHMIVLGYNWSVQHSGGSMYLIIVNATLFNDSPLNHSEPQVNFNAQFRDKMEIDYFTVGNFGPYVTRNEDFTVAYTTTQYYDMTSPDIVWLELS